MNPDKLPRRQYLKHLASSTVGAISLTQLEPGMAQTGSQVIVDGFEDGSLDAWTNIESAETTKSVSYAGDRSLLITDQHTVENDGKPGNSIIREVEPIAPPRLTAALRMDDESFNTVRTTWSGNDKGLTVRIGYSDNGSGLAINGNVIQQSDPFSWYFIELSDIDWADNRIGEIKINGTVVETELTSTTLPETIANVELSAHAGGTGAQGFFDEITIGIETPTSTPTETPTAVPTETTSATPTADSTGLTEQEGSAPAATTTGPDDSDGTIPVLNRFSNSGESLGVGLLLGLLGGGGGYAGYRKLASDGDSDAGEQE